MKRVAAKDEGKRKWGGEWAVTKMRHEVRKLDFGGVHSESRE